MKILVTGATGFIGTHVVATELLCQSRAVDCSESWEVLGKPQVPVLDAVEAAVDWFRGKLTSTSHMPENVHPVGSRQ
jgi:UDP-glucose 4-epimerase